MPAVRSSLSLLGFLALSGCLDQVAELVPVPLPGGNDGGLRVRVLPPVAPGCNLVVSPEALDFGNVIVNSSLSDRVTLVNDGGGACQISGVALAPGSDGDFSLPAQQTTAFTLWPETSTELAVIFNAGADTLPHLRQGVLTFLTSDGDEATARVPLSAYINDNCSRASQLIYTVDEFGELSSFDPETLAFEDITRLSCPYNPDLPTQGLAAGPFSMNVDQDAIGWVLYTDGELFRVDTGTGACTATDFQVGQQGFLVFGMGSVFQTSTGVDTLYIAGGFDYQASDAQPSSLGSIAFPSLVVTRLGTVSIGWPELAGTGDGELWGFVQADRRVSTTGMARLAQLDPSNGDVLLSYDLPGVADTGAFAMKFYGGSFWIFAGESLYQVRRSDGALLASLFTGRQIVGAGVSTCAPVQ